MKQKTIKIDEDLHSQLEYQCEVYKMSKNELLNKMLLLWLEKQINVLEEIRNEDKELKEINDDFWN